MDELVDHDAVHIHLPQIFCGDGDFGSLEMDYGDDAEYVEPRSHMAGLG